MIERGRATAWTGKLLAAWALATGALAGAAFAQAPAVERDCADCPELVRIAAGSVAAADGRTVAVDAPFAIGRTEVTREQFLSLYPRGPGAPFALGCRVRWGGDTPTDSLQATLATPDFEQGPRHPAVCVSFEEAAAYAAELSRRTGRRYALPSAAQWEYAARAGARGAAPWSDPAQACVHANGLDAAAQREYEVAQRWRMGLHLSHVFPCDDRFAHTAPVGGRTANAFGLHDMLGNVAEWTTQCALAGCARRVARGGSWTDRSNALGFSTEATFPADERDTTVGFRVVRLD